LYTTYELDKYSLIKSINSSQDTISVIFKHRSLITPQNYIKYLRILSTVPALEEASTYAVPTSDELVYNLNMDHEESFDNSGKFATFYSQGGDYYPYIDIYSGGKDYIMKVGYKSPLSYYNLGNN